MIFPNFLLAALAFSALYPLSFWIRFRDPFQENVRKFNIALPNIVGGFVLVSVWLIAVPLPLKLTVTAWKAVLLSVSSYSWKKEYPNPKLMTLPFLFGIYAFLRLQAYFAMY
jgi:hypothetical protein